MFGVQDQQGFNNKGPTLNPKLLSNGVQPKAVSPMISASKTHEEWAVGAAGVQAAGFKNLRSKEDRAIESESYTLNPIT